MKEHSAGLGGNRTNGGKGNRGMKKKLKDERFWGGWGGTLMGGLRRRSEAREEKVS